MNIFISSHDPSKNGKRPPRPTGAATPGWKPLP